MRNSAKVVVFGLLASTVMTGQRAAQAHPLTGPFIGLEGNALYGRMKVSSKAKERPELKFEDKAEGAFGGGVGGFAGYGFVFDNGFYLAGELNGDFFFGGENKNKFSILASNKKTQKDEKEEEREEAEPDHGEEDEPEHRNERGKRNKAEKGDHKTRSVPAALVTRPRWAFGTSVQLGYAVTPHCVVYGSGGVNVQGLKTKLQINDQDLADKKTKQNAVILGTVGLGVRYWMTPNMFLGVEGEAMFGRKEKWSLEKASDESKKNDQKDAEDARAKEDVLNTNVRKICESSEFTEKMSRRNYGGRLCIGYKF